MSADDRSARAWLDRFPQTNESANWTRYVIEAARRLVTEPDPEEEMAAWSTLCAALDDFDAQPAETVVEPTGGGEQ